MASPFLTSLYLTLIVYFYDMTNGFGQENLFQYCFLKSVPIFVLSSLIHLGHGNLEGIKRFSQSLGLFFSGIGDFIISFHAYGIVTGAIAFGIGHLFYMATFALHLKKVSTELVVITLIYGIFMNHFFLMPQFFLFPFSTIIMMAYSLILCTAFVISGSLYFNGTKTQPPYKKNNLLRFIGYILFFLSDSLLLLVHAGQPLPHPALIVLSTYYTAQYFILWGCVTTHNLTIVKATLKDLS